MEVANLQFHDNVEVSVKVFKEILSYTHTHTEVSLVMVFQSVYESLHAIAQHWDGFQLSSTASLHLERFEDSSNSISEWFSMPIVRRFLCRCTHEPHQNSHDRALSRHDIVP